MTVISKRTPEELGEMMLEELLEESADSLVELMLQTYYEQTQKRQPISVSPAVMRTRKQLGTVAADCLDTYRPESVDIPKALLGLEEVMRAPIGVLTVEVFMAAVAHRLLSIGLEQSVNQTQRAAA